MKLALKLLIVLSGIVSAIALGALLHVLAGLFFAGPFLQVFNHAEYRDLEHLLHIWAAYSLTAIALTIWLWRTYRRQYGRLSRSG
jgi:heme A synthase